MYLTNLKNLIRTQIHKHRFIQWYITYISHSVVLSTFAENFHTVKISVLVYTEEETDIVSEICSNVVMAEAVAMSSKMLIRRTVERRLLVPMLDFPATPSPRACEVCAVVSIYICFTTRPFAVGKFCLLEFRLAKICSKSVIQFLTGTYEGTIEGTFRTLWSALSLAYDHTIEDLQCLIFFL